MLALIIVIISQLVPNSFTHIHTRSLMTPRAENGERRRLFWTRVKCISYEEFPFLNGIKNILIIIVIKEK